MLCICYDRDLGNRSKNVRMMETDSPERIAGFKNKPVVTLTVAKIGSPKIILFGFSVASFPKIVVDS